MNTPEPEEIIMALVLLVFVFALFGATLALDKRITTLTPMKYEEPKEREPRYIDEDLSDDIDDWIEFGERDVELEKDMEKHPEKYADMFDFDPEDDDLINLGGDERRPPKRPRKD